MPERQCLQPLPQLIGASVFPPGQPGMEDIFVENNISFTRGCLLCCELSAWWKFVSAEKCHWRWSTQTWLQIYSYQKRIEAVSRLNLDHFPF
jgi:hypothetical protein